MISHPKFALCLPELSLVAPELRVAFGILAQAAFDAVKGDAEAAAWLVSTGADWADDLAGDRERIFDALLEAALTGVEDPRDADDIYAALWALVFPDAA